jgi:hypothetical protein
LLPAIVIAQDSMNITRPAFLSGLSTYDFPKAYGFTTGISVPFHAGIKEKWQKDFGKANSEKDEFISAELGGYHHPLEYTAIIFNAGIGIRYIRSAMHFTELSFNQGLFRTFYDGVVYELDQNGNIKERKLFGRTYLTTGFAYSADWSVTNLSSNLWFIQLRPSVWLQYPYNSFLKMHCSLQAGISYRLKNIRVHTQINGGHLL